MTMLLGGWDPRVLDFRIFLKFLAESAPMGRYCLALKIREEIRNKNNNGWGNFRELWPKYLPLAYFYRNIEMYEKRPPPP